MQRQIISDETTTGGPHPGPAVTYLHPDAALGGGAYHYGAGYSANGGANPGAGAYHSPHYPVYSANGDPNFLAFNPAPPPDYNAPHYPLGSQPPQTTVTLAAHGLFVPRNPSQVSIAQVPAPSQGVSFSQPSVTNWSLFNEIENELRKSQGQVPADTDNNQLAFNDFEGGCKCVIL